MNFPKRFCLAFVAFFSVLFRRDCAERFQALRMAAQSPALPEANAHDGAQTAGRDEADTTTAAGAQPGRDALHLLAILQREGRLVDFLQENIAGFADADIGAAARAVHDGCKKALDNYLPLTPVRTEAEGSEVVIEADAAQGSVTLTGNLAGNAPFRGQLCHRGWKVTEVRLPEVAAGKDLSIVAPAEVELS